MRVNVTLLGLCLCSIYVAAVPKASQRIIGGSVATISQYPALAALLRSSDLIIYAQVCGGSILNARSILTAATCTYGDAPNRWRVRVGSSYGNSGGTVHNVALVITHPNFDSWDHDSDIAIIQTATYITFVNNAVQVAQIAGPNYIPADNEVVWAAGWGSTYVGGSNSEQLRHAQLRTVNQATCRSRYTSLAWPVTDNMLCSVDAAGTNGQCEGDNGSPLLHNGVIVGVFSWGYQCALFDYPSVNTRISRFTAWIQDNA